MITLSRKEQESIKVKAGDKTVIIKVVQIKRNRILLQIDADNECLVLRSELDNE